MKFIKAIFPNYVSKKELKRKLETALLMNQPKLNSENVKIQKYSYKVNDDRKTEIPKSFILDNLINQLTNSLRKNVNIEEINDLNGNTIYIASIEVVERRNK